MRILYSIVLICFLYACGNDRKVKLSDAEKPRVLLGFDQILHQGDFHVIYRRSIGPTDQQRTVIRKLSNQLETNPKVQYFFSRALKGSILEYEAGLGITRSEFEQFIKIFNNELSEERNGQISINKEDKLYWIKGKGELSTFDSLQFNIEDNLAVYKNTRLSRVSDTIGILKVPYPKDETLTDVSIYSNSYGLASLVDVGDKYEVVLGRLQPSNRRYLTFYFRSHDLIQDPTPLFYSVIIGD